METTTMKLFKISVEGGSGHFYVVAENISQVATLWPKLNEVTLIVNNCRVINPLTNINPQ